MRIRSPARATPAAFAGRCARMEEAPGAGVGTMRRSTVTTHIIDVPLRWRDLDTNGHVYHGTYLTLLDEARSTWLRSGLALAGADSHLIARLEIDYVSELTVDAGTVAVECAIERVGTTSLRTAETMRTPDGAVVARSHAVVVFWDRETRRSAPPSAEDRARLEAALADQPAQPPVER